MAIKVVKLNDRVVKITEDKVLISELCLEDLYMRKSQIEAELVTLNEKIQKAEALGIIRGY